MREMGLYIYIYIKKIYINLTRGYVVWCYIALPTHEVFFWGHAKGSLDSDITGLLKWKTTLRLGLHLECKDRKPFFFFFFFKNKSREDLREIMIGSRSFV